MQTLVGTAPLAARDLALSVLADMVILPVVSLEKRLRSRTKRAPAQVGGHQA
jgi:hypothetical protein